MTSSPSTRARAQTKRPSFAAIANPRSSPDSSATRRPEAADDESPPLSSSDVNFPRWSNFGSMAQTWPCGLDSSLAVLGGAFPISALIINTRAKVRQCQANDTTTILQVCRGVQMRHTDSSGQILVWRPKGVEGVEILNGVNTAHFFPKHFHDTYCLPIVSSGRMVSLYRGKRNEL